MLSASNLGLSLRSFSQIPAVIRTARSAGRRPLQASVQQRLHAITFISWHSPERIQLTQDHGRGQARKAFRHARI